MEGRGVARAVDPDPFERIKRRMYVCACLLGIPVDGLGWLKLSEDPAIAAAYGVITFGLVVAALLAVSPLRIAVAERIALALVAALFLGRLAVVLFLTPDLGTEFGELITSLVVLSCVYVMAFVFLTRKRALLVSLVVLGSSGALIAAALTQVAASSLPHSGMPLIKAFVMQPVFLALLYITAVIKEEVGASQAREQVLAELATTDALTGVPNRRHLDESLQRLAADAGRHGRPLSVVLVDVDRFKAINDTYGHEIGDNVLRHVTSTLSEVLRISDVFGRWGGEEFLIITVGSDLVDAQRLAERCRERLHQRPSPDVGLVTASFGVAVLSSAGDTDAMLRAADDALYEAKDGGRDRVVAGATGVTQSA